MSKVQVPFTCFECNELVPAGGKALHVCGGSAAEQPPGPAAGFVKADQAKARMDLLPPKVLEGVAQVLTFGAKKYAAWNWVKAPAYGRYFAAVQRHLTAWQAGEDLDPETGLPHLNHALCGLMFLAELQRLGVAEDDRPTDARLRGEARPGPAADLWMKGDARKCALCGNDGDWHAEGNNNISKCRGYSPPEPPAAEPLPVEDPAVTAALAAINTPCQECQGTGFWHTDVLAPGGDGQQRQLVKVTCHVCRGVGRLRLDGSALPPLDPPEPPPAQRCVRCRYPVTPGVECTSCGAPPA